MSSNHQHKSNDGTIGILKVAEANSRDVRRRIGTVDPKVASEMALSTGDAIEISAAKTRRRQFTLACLPRGLWKKADSY